VFSYLLDLHTPIYIEIENLIDYIVFSAELVGRSVTGPEILGMPASSIFFWGA
jgi:hypothetical protein